MADSGRARAVSSRKEIQERVIAGLERSFDPSIELTLYLRACERLLRESQTSQAEEDNEQAYFVLLRLVELIVTYIPRHPAAKEPRYATSIKKLNKSAPRLFQELDVIKTRLDADYERYRQQRRADLAAQAKHEAEVRTKHHQEAGAQTIDALAKHDDQRAGGRSNTKEDVLKRFEALKVNVVEPKVAMERTARPTLSFEYPSLDSLGVHALPGADNGPAFSTTAVPLRPPKFVPDSPVTAGAVVTTESVATPPGSGYQFATSAALENGDPLKTVFMPSTLRTTFLALAESNTVRNLETCGILSGILRQNAYLITTLIVPSQESTADTCHTTDEAGLFTYQDEHALFTLGWIHTHPTQTCFLSSVDLHTQAGYQLMLPEAVAVVCAPSKVPDWGTFRLSDPPGLGIIRHCRRSGLFHPHDEVDGDGDGDGVGAVAGLYRSAMGAGGHLKEVKGMSLHVEDQRSP